MFKDLLFISVSISLFDLFLLFTLKLLVAAIEELRIELELKSELDLVSPDVSIVSELELELIEILFRLLKIVSVFSLIYQ
jgi:hypothetical protein